jgi:predicted RNase H-like HicB family nuclease
MPTDTALKTTNSGAVAVHGQDGIDHFVGIGNLRVIICQEDDQWFAQGLEIDYAADGSSFEEVKQNFQSGLRGTIELHLKSYGSLDKLLKIAPQAAWTELLKDGTRMRYTQVSLHTILEQESMPIPFPFANIDYLERLAA